MDVTVRVTDASADTALPVPHLQAL